MKKIFILLAFVGCIADAEAQQNHVFNGSFEDTFKCPPSATPGSLGLSCAGWQAAYFFSTPDFYHPCSNIQYSRAPNNWLGYQQAADGVAYLGIVDFTFGGEREYIQGTMTPLQPGKLYEVSISVSHCEYELIASNGLGVFFFDQGANIPNNPYPMNLTPQVSYAHYGPITDTQNWVRLIDTLVADSAYDNIVIGGFIPNNQLTLDTLPGTGGYESYYYIDSVVVKRIEDLTITYNNSTACAGDSIHVPYVVVNQPAFTTSNTFILQLSHKTGIFNSVTVLDTITGNTSGTFHVRLPSTLPESGSYKLRILSSNSADTFIWDGTLGIGNRDSANIQVSCNSPLCVGDTLKLTATNSASSISYNWTGPLSFNSTMQNPSVINTVIANSGNYYSTIRTYGCTQRDTLDVQVNVMLAQPSAGNNSPICVGETLNLTASTIQGATYVWTGPNNFISNSQNPSIVNTSLSDTGIYTVKASNRGCNSPGASIKVNINPIPFAVIFATPAGDLCVGDKVTFTALPNNAGGAPSYTWLVNNQSVIATGTTYTVHSPNNGDVIRCDMTESTKCSIPYTDQSNDIQMTVLPWLAPSVHITANPNHPLDANEFVTFTATATNAGTNPKYQWKRNGQNIIGATGSVWSTNMLNDNDSISVEVISDYKCSQPATATSNRVKVQMTGVDNAAEITGLKLYPNPNNGKFVIEAEAEFLQNGILQLDVINMLGQVIYSDTFQPTGNKMGEEINLSSAAKGVYMLRLSDAHAISITRFSVE